MTAKTTFKDGDECILQIVLEGGASFGVRIEYAEASRLAQEWTAWRWKVGPDGKVKPENPEIMPGVRVEVSAEWKPYMIGGNDWGVDMHKVAAMYVRKVPDESLDRRWKESYIKMTERTGGWFRKLGKLMNSGEEWKD